MAGSRPGVARVFYQELKEGDRRKIQAESNDALTGGGARDLRLPEARFRDFFERLLPQTIERRSSRRTVTARIGRVKWPSDNGVVELDLEIWPPQDKRPTEIRIARVNSNFPSDVPEGRAFVLLLQNTAGEIWGQYTTEADLRTGEWDERVRARILRCIDVTPPTRSVRGFVDLNAARSHCHG